MGKTILPALTKEQVEYLIGVVESPRDKAIISLFTESGLRLSELAKIKASDIDWPSRTIPRRGGEKPTRQGPQRGSSAVWQPLRGVFAGMVVCVQSQREYLGTESLGRLHDAPEVEGGDRSTLQPSHLPPDVRLSAQEGRS